MSYRLHAFKHSGPLAQDLVGNVQIASHHETESAAPHDWEQLHTLSTLRRITALYMLTSF